MQCWGYNLNAQLGDGTLAIRRLPPVDVVGLASGVTAVAASLQHTCALISGGAVVCWGNDGSGQLGDNATTRRLSPTLVIGQPAVKAFSAGGLHSCAVVGSGAVQCWGANDNGQLGDGSIMQQSTPVAVTGLGDGDRHGDHRRDA